MAVTLLVNFVMIFPFLHGTVYCAAIAQKNVEAPFKTRCSITCETPQEKLTEGNFPLYQCSCSRSCSVYGDCCFDSKHRNETLWHKTDFVCLSLVGHGKYLAVSGCPPDQPSDFCKDGLGHLPPVTSKKTNITYANIFCATCNRDRDDLVKWNVELSCSTDEDEVEVLSNVTTRIIYNLGDIWRLNEADGSKKLCMYRVHFNDSSFLTGLELRSCSLVNRISACSASWRDLRTMQMCRSYEDPVYFHNTMYQNSHCAECNYLNPVFADCIPFRVKTMLQLGLMDSNVGRFCQTRGSDSCIQILSGMQKGRPYAFSDLLNIDEKMCLPPQGKRCCVGEAFDFRTKRCRKVKRG